MNASQLKEFGYVIIRIGIGALLARHGFPKITGGINEWVSLGGAMKDILGISFLPAVWGFMAAVAEFFGGICIALGFLFRPACALPLCVMIVAFAAHMVNHDQFGDWAESAEVGIVLLGMLLMGEGKFSLSISLNK